MTPDNTTPDNAGYNDDDDDDDTTDDD